MYLHARAYARAHGGERYTPVTRVTDLEGADVIDHGHQQDTDVEHQPKGVGVQADIAELVAVQVLIGRFRHVAGIGWYEYREGAWRSEPGTPKALRDAVRNYIGQRVADLRADGRGEQALLWKAALRKQELEGVLYFAEAMHQVLTSHTELDRDPMLVNCRNGVLNLNTGMLNPHNPSLLLTKQAGAGYQRGARSSTWDALLEAVPVDAQPWLQARFGQALTGYMEDSLVLTVGGGQNGKSAFMAAIMRAFGTYGRQISHRVLQVSIGQHPTELMSLQGLRLALLEETPEEGNLDTHQLKTVIGTPYITARKMRQDDVTFETTHTLFVNTNHYPLVATTDHGTWRRLTACRFPFRFVDPVDGYRLAAGERWGDTDLKARIMRDPDLPAAALAWVVEGARRWVNDKTTIHVLPPSVRDATAEWRADSDVGYQFANEHLELAPHALIPVEYMLTRFNDFLEQQGKKAWSNRVVAGRLPGSIRAALGLEVTPGVIKVQERHQPGIGEAFGLAKHPMPAVGKTMRAWVGVRFRAPEGHMHTPVDEPWTERGHEPAQLELEAEG